MIADLLFLMFGTILLVAALGVVTARNTVYSVLFMVLAFVNASALFILLEAEFLGLLLLMVYVGAIAVMFLFVVMTIDVDEAVANVSMVNYLPMGVLVAGVLLAQICAAIWGGMFSAKAPKLLMTPAPQEQNIIQLGNVLFDDYAYPFIVISLILLVAMVGAIVLAHNKRKDVKRQDVPKQVNRDPKQAMVLTRPKTGAGTTASHWQPQSVEGT